MSDSDSQPQLPILPKNDMHGLACLKRQTKSADRSEQPLRYHFPNLQVIYYFFSPQAVSVQAEILRIQNTIFHPREEKEEKLGLVW